MEWEVLASGYGLVEGPTIDTDGSLLFSDVLGGGVYRRSTDGAIETVVPKRRGVGGIAVHANGGIVCSGRDIVHVQNGSDAHAAAHRRRRGLERHRLRRRWPRLRRRVALPGVRADAEVVPGEVWQLDADVGPDLVFDNVLHANGIAFAPGEGTIYASDSRAQR